MDIFYKYISSLIILFILFFSNISGQDFFIQKFRTQQGLSQNQVWSIKQDRYGFLWVGTRKGLNRFDGVYFKKYFKGDHIAIHSHIIQDIVIDSKNIIWVAAEFGFYGLQVDKQGNILNGFGPFLNEIQIFDIDYFGNKLILATDNGIYEYIINKNKIKRTNHWLNSNPEELFIFVKCINDDEYITSSTLDYYYQIKSGKIKIINSNVQNGFDMDVTHNKIIATLNGLAKLGTDNTIKKINSDINDLIPYRINYNKNYGYFVGTYANSIYLLNEQFEVIHSFENKVSNFIMDVFIDKNQIIWVASDGDGIFSINPTQFTNFIIEKDKHDNMVWALKADENSKNITYATMSEIVFIDENEILSPAFNNEFKNNSINCIEMYSPSNIYVGTEQALYQIVNQKKILKVETDMFRGERDILSLKIDKDDYLWIGTDSDSNIVSFKDDNWEFYNYSEGDKSSRIRKIEFNNQNKLWFITDTKLVTKSGIYWEDYHFDGNKVYDFDFINDSLVIVGTENGIWKVEVNNNIIEKYNINLPRMSSVYSIKYVDDNSLYVGTDNGVYEYNETNKQLTHYGVKEGITELETNSRTMSIDGSGQLWLGTTKGVFKKNKTSLIIENKPSIYVASILSNDSLQQKFNIDGFTTTTSNIKFRFDSIDMLHNVKPVIRWRFLGSDNNWKTTELNILEFNWLPARNYRLQCQGVWPNQKYSEIIEIPFEIELDILNSQTFHIILYIIFILISIGILARSYIVENVKIPHLEIQLFGNYLNIKIKGESLGKSIFHSEKSRAIFQLLVLKKIINNSGINSSEIDYIFWSKIDKDKIKNRKNVTISNIRKVFNKFELKGMISNINGVFYFNSKNIGLVCDLDEFIIEFNKAEKSVSEKLSLDAIRNYQNCINIYGFDGINNPLEIKEIIKYQMDLHKKVITASNYLILNKQLVFDEKSLSIAKHLVKYNS